MKTLTYEYDMPRCEQDLPTVVYLIETDSEPFCAVLQRVGMVRCGYMNDTRHVMATRDQTLWAFIRERVWEYGCDAQAVRHPVYTLWGKVYSQWETIYPCFIPSCIFTSDSEINYDKLRRYKLLTPPKPVVYKSVFYWEIYYRKVLSFDSDLAYDIAVILRYWGFSQEPYTGDWVASEKNLELYEFMRRRSQNVPMEDEEPCILAKYKAMWDNLPREVRAVFECGIFIGKEILSLSR